MCDDCVVTDTGWGTSFVVDWNNPGVCIRHSDDTTSRKSDFAIQLVALVEAGENTGYLADVERAIDKNKVGDVICVYVESLHYY